MLTPDISELALPNLRALFAPVESQSAIGLAVSGGADSLALMLLVHQWKQLSSHGPKIFVYALDHGLRPEASEEVASVVTTASELGFTARGLVWEGEKPDTGVQAAARQARYRIIGNAMDHDGALVLLTGHHLHDQAETILMRLAHGSGLAGLAGMKRQARVEGINLFRPLLELSPCLLVQIVKSAGLTPIIDPSNTQEKYERVRWRKAMPELSQLGLSASTLSRFAARMARADKALNQIAQSNFSEHVSRDRFGGLIIESVFLLEMGEEMGVRILAMMVDMASGQRGRGELAQLENLFFALGSGQFEGQTIAGCAVRKQGDTILVFRESARADPTILCVSPGQKATWDQRFVVRNNGKEDLWVGSAGEITRAEAESLFGEEVLESMAQVHAVPLVRDLNWNVLALGTQSFDKCVSVAHKLNLSAP